MIRNGLTALGLHLRLLGKNYLELVCDFFAVVERSSHQQLTVVMNRTIVTVSRFPEVQTIRRILWVSILIRRIVEGGVSFFCCWEGPALRPEDPKLVRFARLTSSRQVGWPSARLARRLANSHVGELGDVPYRLVVLSRGKKVPLHNSNVRGAMDVLVFFLYCSCMSGELDKGERHRGPASPSLGGRRTPISTVEEAVQVRRCLRTYRTTDRSDTCS